MGSKYFPAFKESLPSVEGKVFVITGTTSGTGFVAAKTVAEKGGVAVLLNRKSQRLTDSLAKLQEAVPGDGKFVSIECDLQDFASVKKAAEEIKSKYKQIYCLANNAGIMMTPDTATKDGCDTQMQTNHLSHFILAKELLPLLETEAAANGDARIVQHSSGAREMTKNGLEQKYFEKNGGSLGGDTPVSFMGPPMHRYAQTKLANSVLMYTLHGKLQANDTKSKVKSIACHPGGSSTNLGNDFSSDLPFYERWIIQILLKLFIQTAEDGTMGLLTGMMATDAQSGILYGPKNGLYGPAVPNPPKDYETDPVAQKMLWDTSEATTGTTFTV